ncbi:MAG TPA: cytochrome d ubiquinol oxidase subunit II [Chloroflexota bacterium]|jgi:cytochrome d ubiquinol oxidase subunit II|nr:cytochrome d ubiquinol oxidase subunit II [Chloroflexota bacterium]
METLWFILVGFMLTMYVVLDGFDLGVGAIHLFVAKTEHERHLVLEAIGPVWDGNEVWLIAAGGTLFFTFPRLYGASFSGFYLPLMIVLWLLMLRGLAVELRSRGNPVWRGLWDALFWLASGLLPIFLGAGLANVVRGVPLNAQGYFFEALWTDFDPRSSNPGVLDWYTVLIGGLAFTALLMHGANYLGFKTEAGLQLRARRLAARGWLATVLLTVLGTAATFYVRPMLLGNFAIRPWGAVLPLAAVGGLVAVRVFHARCQDGRSLLASGVFLAGMLASSAFALYPDVLPATDRAYSLTVTNAAAPPYGLAVGLAWWSLGMLLALIYFAVVYRLFWGKVRLADERY